MCAVGTIQLQNYLALHEIYMGLERDKYCHVRAILVLVWKNKCLFM